MSAVSSDADLCVIGGGEAGFSAALAGAALGLRVTLIDRGAADPCWRNWDIGLALLREAGRAACDDGGSAEGRASLHGFQTNLQIALERAAPDRRFARLEAMNIRVLRGTAAFEDPRTIRAGGVAIRARRIVLATGAVAPVPPDADPKRVLTLDQLRDPEALIEEFRALGGDARTVSLCQGLSRLGAAVTLDAPDPFLAGIDPELTSPLVRSLKRDGVTMVDEIEGNPAGSLGSMSDSGGCWFHAGEAAAPCLNALDLERAGIATRDGQLVLSPALRTTNARVYAIGAVAGARSSQAAQAQVAVALKNGVFRLPVRYDAAMVPFCAITDPAVATVGLSETQARAQGPVTVWRWPFAETSAGFAGPPSEGHLKVIADRHGRVLGAGLVGAHAAEQIAFWALAVRSRSTLQHLADVALPAPSGMEASRRLIMLQAARRLQSPWIRRALAVMQRLGPP